MNPQGHSQALCIERLINVQAKRIPLASAIVAPGRNIPLTYAGLRSQMEEVLKTLRAMRVARHHRVAIVLPNGPEMAVAFLAVAASAVAAPLNPAYRESEFDFHLSDL